MLSQSLILDPAADNPHSGQIVLNILSSLAQLHYTFLYGSIESASKLPIIVHLGSETHDILDCHNKHPLELFNLLVQPTTFVYPRAFPPMNFNCNSEPPSPCHDPK